MDIIKECTEEWKELLRAAFITGLTGKNADSIQACIDVGRYYMCYAPESLFKYYSDKQQNFDAVANNRMWYSAPCNFNDVFDCDIVIDDDKIFESIRQMCPSVQDARAGSPLWKKLKAQVKESKKGLRMIVDQMRTGTGITCMSEADDSLLMWAHYANNHRGMCVEYNLLEINQQLHFTPVPIIYSYERVVFDSLHSETVERDMTKLFIESLTTKSPEWSYEKEWRIIREDSACGTRWDVEKKGALLDAVRPKSVILGCMVEQDFENRVRKLCEAENINLYKMERDERKYGLVKIPVLQFHTE